MKNPVIIVIIFINIYHHKYIERLFIIVAHTQKSVLSNLLLDYSHYFDLVGKVEADKVKSLAQP